MRISAIIAFVAVPLGSACADMKYRAPGALHPATSGSGYTGRKIFAPTMGFPIRLKNAEDAFLNSQVWGNGGDNGPKGTSQSDKENFSMPWADNFCEKRTWDMPLCPGGKGHQGQDIRGPSAQNDKWEVVAVEDGQIINVTSNTTITLRSATTGTVYYYLHTHPQSIRVKPGDNVKKGVVLARISNWLDGKPNTTVHLHFGIRQNVSFGGTVKNVYVPPYSSLVEAYRVEKGLGTANEGGFLKKDTAHELP